MAIPVCKNCKKKINKENLGNVPAMYVMLTDEYKPDLPLQDGKQTGIQFDKPEVSGKQRVL